MTQCHGTDLQGGLSGVACTTCHTRYPHPADWKTSSIHGPVAQGVGKALCRACHGSDLQGGTSGVSCTQCHAQYPHVAGWIDAAQHGAFVGQNGPAGCATACHGTDLQGGVTGIACDSCHTLYPHDAAWPTAHGQTARTMGKTACAGCHGADFKTLLNGKNCYSCHPDYPHPDPATWEPFTGGHGERVNVAYGGDSTSCTPCHGADLSTVIDDKNCASCHPAYPHPATPQMPCTACHGDPVDFSEADTKASLMVQKASPYAPTCYACHWAYPHQSWDASQWAPVKTYSVDSQGAPCGKGSEKNFGHIMYIAGAPLFVTAAGQHPSTANFNDPLWTSAIQNTCGGGTNGSCHFDGHRSFKTNNSMVACGQYCHGPMLPEPPTYPPCPTPPPLPCNPDEEEC